MKAETDEQTYSENLNVLKKELFSLQNLIHSQKTEITLQYVNQINNLEQENFMLREKIKNQEITIENLNVTTFLLIIIIIKKNELGKRSKDCNDALSKMKDSYEKKNKNYEEALSGINQKIEDFKSKFNKEQENNIKS